MPVTPSLLPDVARTSNVPFQESLSFTGKSNEINLSVMSYRKTQVGRRRQRRDTKEKLMSLIQLTTRRSTRND